MAAHQTSGPHKLTNAHMGGECHLIGAVWSVSARMWQGRRCRAGSHIVSVVVALALDAPRSAVVAVDARAGRAVACDRPHASSVSGSAPSLLPCRIARQGMGLTRESVNRELDPVDSMLAAALKLASVWFPGTRETHVRRTRSLLKHVPRAGFYLLPIAHHSRLPFDPSIQEE
eukprot:3669259-Rhodomonas_salina.1